ncbi:MAG: hypothetical protein DMG91_09865 [Acidobacteria bacterium]|nr:MAG: hypothetical protein DMG91_09865 [Acidobacteriota bacterium]
MADEFTSKLDAYLDGELAAADMKALDAHVRACPACAADVLGRVQMKRAIKSASQRYEPRSEFRAKIERRLKPRAGFPKDPLYFRLAGIAKHRIYVARWPPHLP